MQRTFWYAPVVVLSLLTGTTAGCSRGDAQVPLLNPVQIELRLLETTDIHVHLVDYDYYSDEPSPSVGLANTATLIRQAREEVPNTVLVDNGDLIQGNPLGDYMARGREFNNGQTHPVYKAMNVLDYDVGNLGNHEFNYGLEFLNKSLAGAGFPYISANVFVYDGDSDPNNDVPYVEPYIIKEKRLVDKNGVEQVVKIGFIGFVPPQIMIWDRSNLDQKLIAKDMVDMAMAYVPRMKAEGADLVIAIPHSGLQTGPRQTLDENAVYYLAAVPDIDAILFGHSHRVFPGPDYADIAEVDIDKGTVRGVPAVMAGYWGSHLGIIDLTLERIDGVWRVSDSRAEARPISKVVDGETVAIVQPYVEVLDAVEEDHVATLEWISEPIGTTTAAIHSFFARVQDDPSIQIVTEAQKEYVEQQIVGTDLDGLPVLSAGAPFKAGYGSPNNYTDVPEGIISFRNVADLYIYPNTLQVVQVKGSQVREWLERSAGAFNQIDPQSSAPQALLNDSFPSYNFDVIDGVNYEIDITKPSRYDGDGNLITPDQHRIVNLEYNGEDITDDQVFLVATNNYRAGGGGNFPDMNGENIVLSAPDENRQILANYIAARETVDPTADQNWRLAPIANASAQLDVRFATSPKATAFAADLEYFEPTGITTPEGYDVYRLKTSE